MTVAQSWPHTAAIRDALTAAGIRTSLARAPDPRVFPYVVLYSHGLVRLGGTLRDPYADAWPRVQTTTVGQTAEQVERMRDKVNATLLGNRLSITGRMTGTASLETSDQVRRDEDLTTELNTPIFYGVDIFRFFSSPA